MEQQSPQQQQMQRVENPYLHPSPMPHGNGNAGGIVEVESRRAAAEVFVAMEAAQRFPRNPRQSMERIIDAFTRPALAEVAIYEYPRGGTKIRGLSIRAAEVMAQQWGNIRFGWRTIDRVENTCEKDAKGKLIPIKAGKTIVESFAWDLETNVPVSRVFDVPHIRDKNEGGMILNEERDIYEHVANWAARRTRQCILTLIPGDVKEAGLAQAERTMKHAFPVTPDTLRKLLEAFKEYGVTRAMIEARIQRNYDTMSSELMAKFRGIYASLKDEMSSPEDWFDLSIGKEPEGETRAEQIKNLLLAKSAPPDAEAKAPAENIYMGIASSTGSLIGTESPLEGQALKPAEALMQELTKDPIDVLARAIQGTATIEEARQVAEGATHLGLRLGELSALIQDVTKHNELRSTNVRGVLAEINRRATA
jgi:hypothetical protein